MGAYNAPAKRVFCANYNCTVAQDRTPQAHWPGNPRDSGVPTKKHRSQSPWSGEQCSLEASRASMLGVAVIGSGGGLPPRPRTRKRSEVLSFGRVRLTWLRLSSPAKEPSAAQPTASKVTSRGKPRGYIVVKEDRSYSRLDT